MPGPSAPSGGADEPDDGLLFCGNVHESVPRALFLDERLTPLERNAWQIIRMRVGPDGLTAFPTYQSLRPYLTSVPCSGRASDETIARALTLLRLTRWLSVVRHRRRAADGRILGNLYVLHEGSITYVEWSFAKANNLNVAKIIIAAGEPTALTTDAAAKTIGAR